MFVRSKWNSCSGQSLLEDIAMIKSCSLNSIIWLWWKKNYMVRFLSSTIRGFREVDCQLHLHCLQKSLWQIPHYYSERMEKWRTKSMWIVNLYFRGNQEKIRMRIWINNEQIIQQDFCLYQSIVRNPCNTITNFQINLCSNTREIGNKVQSNYDSKNYEKCFFFGVVRGITSFALGGVLGGSA